jgi:hypothetical protein
VFVATEGKLSAIISIADTLEANRLIPAYMTYALTSNMRQGLDAQKNPFSGPYGQKGVDQIFLKALNDGTVDSGAFIDTFNDYLKEIREVIKRNPTGLNSDGRALLKESLELAFDRDGLIYNKLGGKKGTLVEIAGLLGIPEVTDPK